MVLAIFSITSVVGLHLVKVIMYLRFPRCLTVGTDAALPLIRLSLLGGSESTEAQIFFFPGEDIGIDALLIRHLIVNQQRFDLPLQSVRVKLRVFEAIVEQHPLDAFHLFPLYREDGLHPLNNLAEVEPNLIGMLVLLVESHIFLNRPKTVSGGNPLNGRLQILLLDGGIVRVIPNDIVGDAALLPAVVPPLCIIYKIIIPHLGPESNDTSLTLTEFFRICCLLEVLPSTYPMNNSSTGLRKQNRRAAHIFGVGCLDRILRFGFLRLMWGRNSTVGAGFLIGFAPVVRSFCYVVLSIKVNAQIGLVCQRVEAFPDNYLFTFDYCA